MTVRIRGGWVGGLTPQKFIAAQQSLIAKATRAGIAAAANGLKEELRQQVRGAGLGDRLGNAIGANVYPRNEGGSLNAAGYVFPRGPKAAAIFESFQAATVITARKRRWLAIPTDNARLGRRFGLRPTPEVFERVSGVDLVFVAPLRARGRYALLVGESKIRIRSKINTGGKRRWRVGAERKVAKTGYGTLVYFILVPAVRLGKRLDFDSLAQRWADRIPELIELATPRESP